MKLLYKGILLSLLSFSTQSYAQADNPPLKDSLMLNAIHLQDSVLVDTTSVDEFVLKPTIVNDLKDEVDSTFIRDLDKLNLKWYIENIDSVDYIDAAKVRQIKNDRITFSNDHITKHMDSLNSAIQLTNNSIVRTSIAMYTLNRRVQVCNMMGLAEYYFPMFEQELDRQGLPLELKYLPVIESALNPSAYSRMGATGLWQFMLPTGRQYKLKVNSYIDERCDPMKATVAAVSYLKDLYEMYGDWMLAIAAYNCGPGNVKKAIRRSGGKKNYWDIYYRLPKETRAYVPHFIAAMYVFNYNEEYNLYPIKPDFPPLCDTVMIHQPLHFEQIAAVVKMPVDQIFELNPQYRRKIIPATNSRPLAIKMPYNYVNDFVDMQDSVLAYNRLKYFDTKDRIIDPRARYNTYAHSKTPRNRTKILYTVKSGDVVGTIAQKFGVRAKDMRYWNGIKRNRIRIGKKLVLYVPNKNAKKYKSNKNVEVKGRSSKYASNGYVYHKVKSGENLWTIARKYPGVSNKDIMKWNHIRNAKMVKPGKRLKIKR
ncbi:MAG: transglycosylase SLT domain-containing protein [Marinifilaceae bacterium]